LFSNPNDTLRATAPSLSLNAEGTAAVAETTSPVSYSDALRGTNRVDPAANNYQALLNIGATIPGMTRTTQEIDAVYHNIAVTSAARSNFAARRGTSTTIVPAITNDNTGISIIRQLRRLLDTPPLVLLINPSSFSTQYAKIAQFQERSRYGYIYQAWGEELVKLSISCRVGAFTTGKSNPSQTNVPSGVQFASKNDSAAFQQLMAMMTIFQSSAYIVDTVQGSRANYMVGNIAIEYDQNVYVGHMDSFSYNYDEMEQNGGMKFDIDFTVIRTYDVSNPKSFISPLVNPNTNGTNPLAGGTQSGLSRTFRSRGGDQEIQIFTAPGIGTSGESVPQPWRDDTLTVTYREARDAAVTTGGSLLGSANRVFSNFNGDRVDIQVPPSTSINFAALSPQGDPVYVASNQAYDEVPVIVDQITTTLTPVLTSRRGT
jgi:hypothetical protein